jgi:hypothetical protein
MDKILMFVLAVFLATSLNCCVAETHTANIEKFNIQVTSDEVVDFADQFAPSSYPDFTAYLVDMWVGNDLFETVIEDYGSRINVSENALVRAMRLICRLEYPLENEDIKSWVYTDVGGQKGFITNVQVAASIPRFEITYSPDASGNQGTIIVTITAYTADKKKVEDVLKTLQIHRNMVTIVGAQSNITSENKTTKILGIDLSPFPNVKVNGALKILGIDPTAFPNVKVNILINKSCAMARDLKKENFVIKEGRFGAPPMGVGAEVPRDNFYFTGKASGQKLDFAVVFDDTGSMQPEIDAMKSKIKDLTDKIKNSGMDANYALV